LGGAVLSSQIYDHPNEHRTSARFVERADRTVKGLEALLFPERIVIELGSVEFANELLELRCEVLKTGRG